MAGKTAVISNSFINLCQTTTQAIVGGRRSTGGILIFTSTPFVSSNIEILFTCPANNYVILLISNVVFGIAYIPPSASHNVLISFLDKTQHLANGRPMVILGDFNARSQRLSGDHTTNARGSKLQDYISESPLVVQTPVQGQFTTFTQNGSGITDLLITYNIQTFNYTVHEEDSLGGSDHRPLTFDINF